MTIIGYGYIPIPTDYLPLTMALYGALVASIREQTGAPYRQISDYVEIIPWGHA